MRPLAWVGIASLCLGAAWAVPAKEGSRKVEKPKLDLALYENLELDNYDLTLDSYGDVVDLSNYEELYDYGDIAPKVRGTRGSAVRREGLIFVQPGAAPRYGPGLEKHRSPPHKPTSPGGSSSALSGGKASPNPDLLQLPGVLPSHIAAGWSRGRQGEAPASLWANRRGGPEDRRGV